MHEKMKRFGSLANAVIARFAAASPATPQHFPGPWLPTPYSKSWRSFQRLDDDSG
jgi:hypothetical protein